MKRIFFCFLTFMVLSCSKTIEPSLGLYPVYFEVNLNTEWRLQESQAHKIFTKENTNQYHAGLWKYGCTLHGQDWHANQ